MNKYKSLAKDTLIFAIGSIGQKIIQFLLVPIYTNYLSTDEFGIGDLIFTVAQFATPILYLVIYDAVLRFGISKYEVKQNVFVNSLLVWGIGSALCLLITPLFGLYKSISEWKWYLSIYVVIVGLNDILVNYLKACSKNKLYSAMSIIRTLILAFANIFLICRLHLGIKGYVLANIIGSVCFTVILVVFSNILPTLKEGHVDFSLLKRMIIFSSPLIINNVSWWAIHSCDKIMIEDMIGAELLGLYSVAIKIPALMNVFISIFQQAWGISTVKEIEDSNDNAFFSEIFKYYSTFIFFIVISINLIIRPFMSIYVGKEFVDSWKYVPFLLAGSAFSAIAQYYTGIYAALKKSLNTMTTMMAGALLNVLLNYFLIREIGVWGAVVATVVSFFVVASARMIDSNRYIHLNINIIRFAINTTIALLSCCITTFIDNIIISSICLCLYLVFNIDFIKYVLKTVKDKIFNKT